MRPPGSAALEGRASRAGRGGVRDAALDLSAHRHGRRPALCRPLPRLAGEPDSGDAGVESPAAGPPGARAA